MLGESGGVLEAAVSLRVTLVLLIHQALLQVPKRSWGKLQHIFIYISQQRYINITQSISYSVLILIVTYENGRSYYYELFGVCDNACKATVVVYLINTII